jgi:Sigma-70, region 4
MVLSAAIHSLDVARREVFVLRDIEGLSAPEVAKVLGLSVQAVKSRLHRVRLAVREADRTGSGYLRCNGLVRISVPCRAHAVLASCRGRDRTRGLRRDGSASPEMWPLPRRLRVAQAGARTLSRRPGTGSSRDTQGVHPEGDSGLPSRDGVGSSVSNPRRGISRIGGERIPIRLLRIAPLVRAARCTTRRSQA